MAPGILESEDDLKYYPEVFSLAHFADDVKDIMNALHYDKIDVFVGHSLGVQVGLELCCKDPDCVNRLILLNGSYGDAYAQAFQVWMYFGFAESQAFSNWFRKIAYAMSEGEHYKFVWEWFQFLRPLTKRVMALWSNLVFARPGGPVGTNFYYTWFNDYTTVMYSTHKGFATHWKMMRACDEHDCSDQLKKVGHRFPKTLIVSGYADWIMPPRQSQKVANWIPHSEFHTDYYSGHMTIVENHEACVEWVTNFLN